MEAIVYYGNYVIAADALFLKVAEDEMLEVRVDKVSSVLLHIDFDISRRDRCGEQFFLYSPLR